MLKQLVIYLAYLVNTCKGSQNILFIDRVSSLKKYLIGKSLVNPLICIHSSAWIEFIQMMNFALVIERIELENKLKS